MIKPRRPLWLRLLRGTAFTLIVLVTIAALAVSILSFSGRREWAATKADLLARGEKLSLVELAPARGPDTENFFGDPMWKELADVVEVPGENGLILKQPRLLEGQRQIDAWDAPVPADLIARLRKLAPTHNFSPPSGLAPWPWESPRHSTRPKTPPASGRSPPPSSKSTGPTSRSSATSRISSIARRPFSAPTTRTSPRCH